MEDDYLDIVFDGEPGPEMPRLVEVEYPAGKGVTAGKWMDRGNGLWALRIPMKKEVVQEILSRSKAISD